MSRILFYSTRKTRKLDRIGTPGGRFEIFHPFWRKSSKKLKGENFLQSLTMPRKLKWEPFRLARYCTLRGKKRKKLFWPTGTIWHILKIL